MKFHRASKIGAISVAVIAALAATAWTTGHNPISAANAAVANMRSFMKASVGPATQPIWDKSYADKLSDQEWAALRQATTRLVMSINTVSSGGTVAAEQARAKAPGWQDWSKKLSAAANDAKKAADAKDQMALATAGDTLLEVCEGCHMAYDPSAK